MESKLSYEELLDAYHDQELLIEIGQELIRQGDIDRLLRRILEISLQISGADAGSLFLVEQSGKDSPKDGRLRFKYSINTSLTTKNYEEFTMPRTTASIAGYVSLTGKTLNLAHVYELPQNVPYSFNNSFDQSTGYRTCSMLAVPMSDHTGTIVGVIQLINSKEKDHKSCMEAQNIILKNPDDFESCVVPFKQRYESLMEAIASQAAVALENAQMIKRIQDQFEQFVLAAIEAVEQRDPATSGHSYRVAMTAVKLARLLNSQDEQEGKAPRFAESDIKELEYAALLHNFGMEQHVVRSYEFVRRIPWPDEYCRIPDYIKVHHEMLDGSGYPNGLTGGQIPLQGRILAVADVYDALTAADRIYKRAVPIAKALSILKDEARRGRLDSDLVALMGCLVGENRNN